MAKHDKQRKKGKGKGKGKGKASAEHQVDGTSSIARADGPLPAARARLGRGVPSALLVAGGALVVGALTGLVRLRR